MARKKENNLYKHWSGNISVTNPFEYIPAREGVEMWLQKHSYNFEGN
jgi:hypothetical protein